MKVLNVDHLLDPLTGGGTAERTFQMSRSLAKLGVECFILTTDVGLTQERISSLSGIKVLALPCISSRYFIPRNPFKKIINIVTDVDIIHLMGHWTVLNALVYFVARRLGKPYVVCPAGALPVYGRSKAIKCIYNFFVGKKIIKNATRCIAITESEIPQFKEYGVAPEKITVIPNGISTNECPCDDVFSFRDQYDLGTDPFILFMGRLNTIKGPDLLLRAFAGVKDHLQGVRLVFAGPDSGMLSDLKLLTTELNIQNLVHFVGFLGESSKTLAYSSADLLIIPSRHEAMSIVALEAGITGTPVLLTDQCGFDEVATVGGGLVVPASVDGLQQGLLKLIENREQLPAMGHNLKEFVSKNYLWDSVILKFINLYRQLT